MQKSEQHNEQGFAFILELVVVAMVLSAVGFGLYQYKNHTNANVATKTPVTALSTANDVNDSLVKSANIEASESTSADDLANELESADSASADIEGGIDESTF